MLPPSTSQTRTPSAEEIRQIEHDLVSHPLLHGSEALCNLLRYLVERSRQHPDHPAKEHQIATEVFGRPQSFDPRVDSTVRVQTSRLRSKLTEYYATAGAG
ncbi:MAG: helix-turn-helix domain-containing protein, partial [Bryobacteraceae bacterium]